MCIRDRYRVAKAVANHARRLAARWEWCRRPEFSSLFVADVERLAASIADRIIMPGRQAKLVAILTPGVSATAFRNQRAEAGIADDVHPWSRRCLAGTQRDHIFAPVRRKAAQAV